MSGAFSAPTANRLCGPILVSITFGFEAAERRRKLIGKAQPLTLLGPGEGQVAHPQHPGCRQLDRLPPFENGLDDVRGEEGQRQPATDVSLIGLVTLGQVTNRGDRLVAKFFEPHVTLGDGLDQNWIGPGFMPVLIGEDELDFHAAALDPDRELEGDLHLSR